MKRKFIFLTSVTLTALLTMPGVALSEPDINPDAGQVVIPGIVSRKDNPIVHRQNMNKIPIPYMPYVDSEQFSPIPMPTPGFDSDEQVTGTDVPAVSGTAEDAMNKSEQKYAEIILLDEK